MIESIDDLIPEGSSGLFQSTPSFLQPRYGGKKISKGKKKKQKKQRNKIYKQNILLANYCGALHQENKMLRMMFALSVSAAQGRLNHRLLSDGLRICDEK